MTESLSSVKCSTEVLLTSIFFPGRFSAKPDLLVRYHHARIPAKTDNITVKAKVRAIVYKIVTHNSNNNPAVKAVCTFSQVERSLGPHGPWVLKS